MTKFKYLTLEEAHLAQGTVVVIDVLRAFTSAAFAFNSGATKIYPVESVEEGLELKKSIPGSKIMGEVHGYKPMAFDFGNSPATLTKSNIHGKILIQRTSAGTKGVIKVVNAPLILAASFVVAEATAEYIIGVKPIVVSFIITGAFLSRDGDEDRACAEYIEALIRDIKPEPDPFTNRIWTSSVGINFLKGEIDYLTFEDIKLSTQANLFPFYMPVRHEGTRLVMERGIL